MSLMGSGLSAVQLAELPKDARGGEGGRGAVDGEHLVRDLRLPRRRVVGPLRAGPLPQHGEEVLQQQPPHPRGLGRGGGGRSKSRIKTRHKETQNKRRRCKVHIDFFEKRLPWDVYLLMERT